MRFMLISLCALTICGCSGNVMNSVTAQLSAMFSANKGQISFVSNSTSAQAQCAATNSVVLQVSLPANQKFYCREKSTLMDGVQLGPTCAGGVTVNNLSISSAAVDCQNLTLCGVPVSSAQQTAKRSDGSVVNEVTFNNLPWGCKGVLEYSTDPSFADGSTQSLTVQVTPPTCPFCVTTNRPDCGACAQLGSDQTVVAGQVVWTSCTGGACKSCTVNGQTVPHGQGLTFYSAAQNTCPKHCNQISEVRVCNNGLFAGDPSYSFTQCVEGNCGCKLPGSDAIYDSGKTYTIYSNAAPACGHSCDEYKLQVQCQDGSWLDSAGNTLTDAQLSAYSQSQCRNPVCNCTRTGRLAVPDGGTSTVYNVSQVDCNDSCSAHAGTVTCKGGVLSASNPSFLTYANDSCSQKVCSCPLPWGGSLQNGATTKAFAVNQATCDNPTLCSTATNFVSISCTNGVLTSFDKTKYAFPSCSTPVCNCAANGIVVNKGATVYLYSTATPSPPETCQSSSAQFTCQSNGSLTSATGALIANYRYAACQGLNDQGTLGGTGGGTGNDSGPGSALRQKYGLGDGGPGSGCLDAVACSTYGINLNLTPQFHGQLPCILPWGGGEVEFYGSIIAFNKQCVVQPDTCSKHRQSRTCHFPTWTGTSDYMYSSCVEKASCP